MSEWQKCPVCEGSGLVPFDFYWPYQQRDSTSSVIPCDTCRTCQGKGIIEKPNEYEARVIESIIPLATKGGQ